MTTDYLLHVDLTADETMPVRILRVYRHNCSLPIDTRDPAAGIRQVKRLALLDKAIAALERGTKVARGMTAARAKGRLLGRPVTTERYLARLRRLHRHGHPPDKIHRALRGRVSLPWIYLQIRKLKQKKKTTP